uniref:Uncharacterized protein n=1 Tax=Anopheles atroparvus TaxID=41427 RepID=A0A182JFN2_ANOAO
MLSKLSYTENRRSSDVLRSVVYARLLAVLRRTRRIAVLGGLRASAAEPKATDSGTWTGALAESPPIMLGWHVNRIHDSCLLVAQRSSGPAKSLKHSVAHVIFAKAFGISFTCELFNVVVKHGKAPDVL